MNAYVPDQVGGLFELFRAVTTLMPADIALLADDVAPENAYRRISYGKRRPSRRGIRRRYSEIGTFRPSDLRHGVEGFSDLRREVGEGIGEFVSDDLLHLRRRHPRRTEKTLQRWTTTSEI